MSKSLFFKDPLEIIAEATSTDNLNEADQELANEFMSEILEEYKDFERIGESTIPYTAEMMPVLEAASPSGAKRYIIENDFLVKLMAARDLTAKEAMDAVAEANHLNIADLYLVVEGQGDIKQLLKTTSSKLVATSNKNIFGRLKQGCQYFKDLKNSGIKVLQKSDKYIPQNDTDSLMTTSHPDYTSKYGDAAFHQDDDVNPMKGNSYYTPKGNTPFAQDDLKQGSMQTGKDKINSKYGDAPFPQDDFQQGSMYNKNNGVKGKYDNTPFSQDDNTNPMKGNVTKNAYGSAPFANDDANINGMGAGHKGY